jgi:tRNA uridine 5-carboxymethylaminomethyl modification enzyme
LDPVVITQVEIEIKYEGYIRRQAQEVKKFRANENRRIPDGFDYAGQIALSTEARHKLDSVRPTTIGQASRISGISPSDIGVLLVVLKRRNTDNSSSTT